MFVSVLLPTKNENEKILNDFIKGVHTQLRSMKHEIVVIDKSEVPPKVINARLIAQKSWAMEMPDLKKEYDERKGELEVLTKFLPENFREMSFLDIGGGYRIYPKLLNIKNATIIDFDDEYLQTARN